MEPDALPEADRLGDMPHPRHASQVFGHGAAERAVMDAVAADRVHHAWLITGPRGIGKATFAWRLARFLIATPAAAPSDGLFGAPPPPTSLDIGPDHPVARRMRALSEPGLFVLRRPYDDKAKRLKTQITVEETRKLKGFFALSATEGGRRVVLIDAAEEMNTAAANAVLKLLEEPPAGAVLLLVCHRPSALLPTIRSRCRTLKMTPLGAEDMAAALTQAELDVAPDALARVSVLADGSVGAAAQLIAGNGAARYADLVQLMSRAPGVDRPAARAFAEAASSRDAQEMAQSLTLLDLFLARLARTGACGPDAAEAAPGEAQVMARLAPDAAAARHWAELHQSILAQARRGAAANLDPAAILLDTVLKIDAGAGSTMPAR